MERDLSHLPKFLQTILRSEDTTLGVIGAWFVALPLLTLAGFYFGTIAGSDHVKDLQTPDMLHGLQYAGVFAAIGFVVALWVTFVYVPSRQKEEAAEWAAHDHH